MIKIWGKQILYYYFLNNEWSVIFNFWRPRIRIPNPDPKHWIKNYERSDLDEYPHVGEVSAAPPVEGVQQLQPVRGRAHIHAHLHNILLIWYLYLWLAPQTNPTLRFESGISNPANKHTASKTSFLIFCDFFWKLNTNIPVLSIYNHIFQAIVYTLLCNTGTVLLSMIGFVTCRIKKTWQQEKRWTF